MLSLVVVVVLFSCALAPVTCCLSLHDALPISLLLGPLADRIGRRPVLLGSVVATGPLVLLFVLAGRDHAAEQHGPAPDAVRSEEHTSEPQSPDHLVCRLLPANKKDIARYSRRD